MVKDRKGVEIKVGADVTVYQDEGPREATVVGVSTDQPTKNQPGFWVDIDDGSGVEGMMSYILEVI